MNVTSRRGDGAAIHRTSYAASDDIFVLEGSSFTDCNALHGNGGAVMVAGRILSSVRNSSFERCSSGGIGGAIAMGSTAAASRSSILDSHFMDCLAGEKGGGIGVTGAGATLLIAGCEFVRCQVVAEVVEEKCMLLTMKTLNLYDMWGGAVLFLVASDGFESVSSLVPSDLECASPNEFCDTSTYSICKCRCDSVAESILANKSIANFTMDCAIGKADQTKEICLDAAVHGTSFKIVVTSGAWPFAVVWTLGESEADPTTYVADGKANQIRDDIEPFTDVRSASSGYGGGAIYANNSALVQVSRCGFFDTGVTSTFGGGAIYVESEEGSSLAESTTAQTELVVTSSSFQQASASFGVAIYNSLARVTFNNSFIQRSVKDDPVNLFFDADSSAVCTSACSRGQYGSCTALGASCASCRVDVCISCPPGRIGISSGATSLEEGCVECSEGSATSKAGSVEPCAVCTPGTFAADASSVPTSSGAVQCKFAVHA